MSWTPSGTSRASPGSRPQGRSVGSRLIEAASALAETLGQHRVARGWHESGDPATSRGDADRSAKQEWGAVRCRFKAGDVSGLAAGHGSAARASTGERAAGPAGGLAGGLVLAAGGQPARGATRARCSSCRGPNLAGAQGLGLPDGLQPPPSWATGEDSASASP
jgi:hypothetical protein